MPRGKKFLKGLRKKYAIITFISGPLPPIVPNMILLLLFHLALAPLVLSQQLAVSPTT
jgi:hypothetical protein